MNLNTTVIDRIKKNYIQIDSERYNQIKEFLCLIWNKFKKIILIKEVDYENYTIAIFFQRIHFEKHAKFYSTGAHIITPSTRRMSPVTVDPKIKHSSRIDMAIAVREIANMDPEAFLLVLDEFGNLAEGNGHNIFLVSDGTIKTPRGRNVLKGISRETVIELAKDSNIPIEETDLQPYDLYTADEAFITCTSYCILPITKYNWIEIGDGKVGSVTKKLLKTWSEKVNFDIVGQAESHI